MTATRRSLREGKQRRSRRIRALLAGGLVFGIGATVTLAAWNDSEYATATFTAGHFGIVGSIDGTSFAEHPVGSPAALSFTADFDKLSPGKTVYSLFAVKTTPNSLAGTLQLSVASTAGTGLGSYLRYGVRTIPSGACTSAAYDAGTVIVADGSVMSTPGSGTQVVAAAGATTIRYCIAVSLPPGTGNAAQGLTAIQTWLVTGTSS